MAGRAQAPPDAPPPAVPLEPLPPVIPEVLPVSAGFTSQSLLIASGALALVVLLGEGIVIDLRQCFDLHLTQL